MDAFVLRLFLCVWSVKTEIPLIRDPCRAANPFLIFRENKPIQVQKFDSLPDSGNFLCNNPYTFAGLVGKVRKKLSPKGGRKGGWRKKARAARPPDRGLEPGTCRVQGEGPQLHARGAV